MLEFNIQSLKYSDSRVFPISYEITIINLGQIWSVWSFSSPKWSFAHIELDYITVFMFWA